MGSAQVLLVGLLLCNLVAVVVGIVPAPHQGGRGSGKIGAVPALTRAELRERFTAFMNTKGLPIPMSPKENPNFLADLQIHAEALNVTCTRHTVCNEFACTDVCEIGSVVVDTWLSYAMSTQRKLQMDTPLNFVSLPGSHNAAITKATGVGIEEDWLNQQLNPLDVWVYIANNQFSLTDQMNMGVRHLELDIHWFNGYIRICHAGGIHIKLLDELMKALGIDWDSETIGCFNPNARTLNDTFIEIRTWMNKNPGDFLIFYFDDQFDLDNWGKVPLLMEAINYHFGKLVFTPVDKQQYYPNAWPSFNQLQKLGKQVMFASRQNYAGQMDALAFWSGGTWNEWSPDTVIGFPRCLVGGNSLLGNGTMERVLADSLIYGPFWNGYGGGIITQTVLSEMSDCATNFMSMDQVSPALMAGAVWTWATGEPKKLTNGCVSIGPTGRWQMADCTMSFPAVCQKLGSRFDFVVSTTSGPWAKASCPVGYTFSVPTNGLLNSRVSGASGAQSLWVNWTL